MNETGEPLFTEKGDPLSIGLLELAAGAVVGLPVGPNAEEPRKSPEAGNPKIPRIRNKKEVIAHSRIIIYALQESLDYIPDRKRNTPPPALYDDNPDYLALLRELVAEFKKLNALLEAKKAKPSETTETIYSIQKCTNKLLNFTLPVVGTGGGALLLATVATVLQNFGVDFSILHNILPKLMR